jgi:hypothetical protein
VVSGVEFSEEGEKKNFLSLSLYFNFFWPALDYVNIEREIEKSY